MDTLPVFSQIPSIVLKKLNPDDFTANKKRVKFVDDILEDIQPEDPEEVSSSHDRPQSQELDIEKPDLDVSNKTTLGRGKRVASIRAIETRNSEKSTIISESSIKTSQNSLAPKRTPDLDTHVELPKYISVEVQTDETSFKQPNVGCDNQEAKMDALRAYKPLYTISKNTNKPPPLKGIGLTLPKGRKRKVYYPDDDKQPLAAGC